MAASDGYQSAAVEECLRQLDLHGSQDGRPKYERLRSFIASEVVRGRLQPGAILPSEQQLSEILRIARTTVRQAMAELEKDGVVQRRHGAGTFVSDSPENARRLGLDVLALVVPGGTTGFWPSLQAGFQNAAAESHKQILVCNTENDVGKQANIFIQLVQKRVAGVALAPTSLPLTPAYQVRHLQDHGIPVVLCHRGIEEIDAPLLAIPFHEVGRRAGELLLSHGHKRVAYFSMHERTEASAGYEAGLREALHAAGGDLPESLIYWGRSASPDVGVQTDGVLDALRRVFKQPDPPTAIMASFDPLAEHIYLMLPQLGLRVPEDVSLVGFGGTNRDGAITKRLTSIVIDEEDIGRRAAKILKEMSDGQRPLYDTEKIVVSVGVAAGQTLGRV
jgi:GntR family transcriptional regulator, arabinose operon transcriptional repressor